MAQGKVYSSFFCEDSFVPNVGFYEFKAITRWYKDKHYDDESM